MRVGRGVGERSRFFLRGEPERDLARSFARSGDFFLVASASLSELLLTRSFDLARSFDSFLAFGLAFPGLLLLDLEADFLLLRRSVPLLEDDDDDEVDDDELEELEREPDELRDELLSDELPLLSLLLDAEPRLLRSRSLPLLVRVFFSFSFSLAGDADRSLAIFSIITILI